MKPAFVILLLVALAACAPRKEPPPPIPPSPSPAPLAASPSPPPIGPAPPAAQTRPFDESLLTGREFLLESPRVQAAVRDIRLGPVEIGPLADLADTLVQSVAKGGQQPLDPQTLDPRWTDYLQGWARKMNKEGLAGTVRTGAPQPDKEGGVTVPVRVVGDKKEWQGWIYAVKSGSGWLVGDVQLEGRDRDTAPFDPESPVLPR